MRHYKQRLSGPRKRLLQHTPLQTETGLPFRIFRLDAGLQRLPKFHPAGTPPTRRHRSRSYGFRRGLEQRRQLHRIRGHPVRPCDDRNRADHARDEGERTWKAGELPLWLIFRHGHVEGSDRVRIAAT